MNYMASLTQDQIAQLLQQYGQQGLGGNTQMDGQYFSPMGVQSVTDGGVQNTLQGFAQYDPNHMKPGDSYQYFDPTGKDAGTRQWQNGTDYKMALMAALAAVGGAAFLPGGFAAGAAGGVGSAGLSGMDLAADGGANSIFSAGATGTGAGGMGLGAASGAPNTAAMGAGGGTDIFGGNGMATGFTDTGTAGGALDTGYAGSGAVTGLGGGASAGGGGLSSLLPSGLSGMGGLLGPAATLLGAAAGTKGQQSTTTQTRDIPEWLKPYVTKQLNYAGGLLDQQMTPEYMKASTDIRNQAVQGLLAGPQQNANFARFFPGH